MAAVDRLLWRAFAPSGGGRVVTEAAAVGEGEADKRKVDHQGCHLVGGHGVQLKRGREQERYRQGERRRGGERGRDIEKKQGTHKPLHRMFVTYFPLHYTGCL